MTTQTFNFKLDRRTIQKVLSGGKFDEVNFLIREGIEKKRIRRGDQLFGERKIVLVSFDEPLPSSEIKRLARKLKLVSTVQEDSFYFGESFPDEQKKGRIIFLSDSPYTWSGHSFDFALDFEEGKRRITLISSGGNWSTENRFAFQSKE